MLHRSRSPLVCLRLRGAGDLSMLARKSTFQLSAMLFLATLFTLVNPAHARAQGFISPSFGYNFGGDAGCLDAVDCED